MASNAITTKQLVGKKVIGGKKDKRIGKVNHFVFHPTERRCLGFTVKRPDAALMFHRKDAFVTLDGFTMHDGDVVLNGDARTADSSAVKSLGVNWNECVIWVGMPVMTKSGSFLGYVSVVSFDRITGVVESISIERGLANDAIVGKRVVPANLVKGFKRGVGTALVPMDDKQGEQADESAEVGAILVADEAADVAVTGGAAAAAGKATAVVTHEAKKRVVKTKKVAAEKAEQAKPTAQAAAKKANELVDAGAYAAGKQLGRASGMFAAFKEEYDKAAHGDD